MKTKDILAEKGSRVVTMQDNLELSGLVSVFLANRVGSVVVVDNNDNVKGIVAPNDVLRAYHESADKIADMKVSDVMTKEVIVVTPEENIDQLMTIMTENRVRHLPVIDNGKLAGLVSIGDVVKARTTIQDVEIRYLKEYIEGRYPG